MIEQHVQNNDKEKKVNEKPVLRNFLDVLNFIFTEKDEPKPEFAEAILSLKDQLRVQPGWTAEPTNYEVTRAICDEDSGADFLKRTITWLTQTVMDPSKKQVIYDQLIKLVEISKKVIVFSQARQMARIFPKQDKFDYISAEDAVKSMPDILSRAYENEGPKGNDGIEIFYPDISGIEHKINQAMNRFLTVWNTLRCTNKPRKCRILFTYSVGQGVRSMAKIKMNPDVLVELGDENYVAVAGHEAVHAALGETGRPLSVDFEEGCATRLEFAFQHDGNKDFFTKSLTNFIREKIEQGNQVRSSTTLLNMEGAPTDVFSVDTMKYVFGYVLVDTLLKNRTYRRLSESRKSETGRPYQLLMDLNRAMAEYPADQVATVRSRDVVVVGLKKIGYSDAEITQFFTEMDVACKNLPTVSANEYKRQY